MGSPKFGFTAQQIIEKGFVNQEAINEIKTWTQKEINLPTLTDEQIILFITGHGNDFQKIKKTIKAFYALRQENADFFEDRTLKVPKLERLVNDLVDFFVCPKKTPDGCVIVFSRLRDTYYANIDPEAVMKLVAMVFDAAIFDYPARGIILLFDFTGVGFMHLTLLRLRVIKAYFKYLQDCLPIPILQVHVLNCVSLLNKIMVAIKPFLNKETFEKLHFYPRGMEMQEFYVRWVPKQCLPKELGGDLPDMDVLQKMTIKKLIEMEQYFEEEEKQRRILV